MANNPTAAYSLRMRLLMDNVPGTLGRLATAIGAAGGNIRGLEGFEVKGPVLDEELVVDCRDQEHQEELVRVIGDLDGLRLTEYEDRTFALHEGGKIEVVALCDVGDNDDLSMAYTPGVARVCTAIEQTPDLVHDLTIKRNTVAIVTDGTAVLGLGDIGAEASLPVMEGKALLFKEFAGVDAFPICLDVTSADEIVETVERIAPVFGGVNLEDIAAPTCFEVEDRLRESLPIPVFHDDQHGTAVVTLAALENALKIVDKKMQDLSVVIAGAGAAGVAIAQILRNAGVPDVIAHDRKGAIHVGRDDLNVSKQRLAEWSNPDNRSGTLSENMAGADVFIGVSGPGLIGPADVETMAADPIVFAMANPDPEIRPEAIEGLAAVVATGRSDFPNQINNVLAFPGIFRGALDASATHITEEMKVSAAGAIARAVSSDDLAPDHVVPSVFDKSVVQYVAASVAQTAVNEGVTPGMIEAVTFDHWNTLVAVSPRPVLLERRDRLWTAVLHDAGVDHDPVEMAEALDAAGRAFGEAWSANRQFRTADAVDLVLATLGAEVDARRRAAMVERLASEPMEPAPDPAPGVEACLSTLAAAGVRIGIICDVGMTPSTVLRHNLARHGLLDRFHHWSFSDEVGAYKPDPVIFDHALDGLGSRPDRTAHVGDLRRTDVAGAADTGWVSVRYRGLADDDGGDEAAHVEADHVIDHLDDLPTVLGL